jgi:hypothetical protein
MVYTLSYDGPNSGVQECQNHGYIIARFRLGGLCWVVRNFTGGNSVQEAPTVWPVKKLSSPETELEGIGICSEHETKFIEIILDQSR